MGRPPLNVEETKIRIPIGTKRRIEDVAGKNQMAAFIREAIAEKLAREEAAKRED